MDSLDPQESMPVPPTPTSVAPVPERTSTQDSDNDAWRRRKQAKVTFNKTLNGRYGNGPTGYSKVGVLLIYWQGDNARFEQEAKDLEAGFRKLYGFCTKLYAIPSSQDSPALSARSLEARLDEWANEYNGPDKLSIIYYGGHGRKEGHSMHIRYVFMSNAEACHTISKLWRVCTWSIPALSQYCERRQRSGGPNVLDERTSLALKHSTNCPQSWVHRRSDIQGCQPPSPAELSGH
ncbi:uncharacterized protein BKA78DRAFT_99155 [Phyllosticta capitalensis]|uniref:uncharacterized protein n=1 Tax=Phyllosticta capitalensis TaxID=121624 RepID=UPI0031303AD5